jgi:glycosyltransferase involved in cell wall biosynthesis
LDISIVVPVFNEAEALPALHHALTGALDQLGQRAEIVFVDDGSTDGSGDVLDELAHSDVRVQVLHLRRNYGQTAALMAGFQHSTGDVIVPMDGDGQNDPADVPRLLDKLSEGFDVVSGWRVRRDDKFSRRLPSIVANRMISSLLGVPLHDYGCTLKAYRREVIEDVRLYGEMHRFIPIYAAREGARVTEIPVGHQARRFGKSKYGFGRISRVFLDLVTLYFIDRAFDRPMQFFGKVGLAFWAFGFLAFVWALVLKYASDVSLIQTPLPLLAATIGLSGVLFILLGIVAEVQARIYFEGRGKAPYKIKSIVRHSTDLRPTVLAGRW